MGIVPKIPNYLLFGVVLDTLVFLSVGILDVVLFTSVQPHQRGFFCDDESIKYPRLGKETITDTVLILLILSPAVVIIIVEGCYHCIKASRETNSDDDAIKCGPFIIRRWLQRLLRRVFTYGFGVLLNWLFTESCKLYLGSLRPYFLDVCQPTCPNHTLVNSDQSYVMGDVCTGDPHLIMEARLSFPSGHASGGMYAMVFLALYIQVMVTTDRATFLKPLLQAACLMVAFFCGLSRIQDLLHRWSDVLGGFLLGALMALFHANKALKLFKRSPHSEKTQCTAGEIPMYCRSCMETMKSNGTTSESMGRSHPYSNGQQYSDTNSA